MFDFLALFKSKAYIHSLIFCLLDDREIYYTEVAFTKKKSHMSKHGIYVFFKGVHQPTTKITILKQLVS